MCMPRTARLIKQSGKTGTITPSDIKNPRYDRRSLLSRNPTSNLIITFAYTFPRYDFTSSFNRVPGNFVSCNQAVTTMQSLRALRPIHSIVKAAPVRTFSSSARRNEHFLNANTEVRAIIP